MLAHHHRFGVGNEKNKIVKMTRYDCRPVCARRASVSNKTKATIIFSFFFAWRSVFVTSCVCVCAVNIHLLYVPAKRNLVFCLCVAHTNLLTSITISMTIIKWRISFRIYERAFFHWQFLLARSFQHFFVIPCMALFVYIYILVHGVALAFFPAFFSVVTLAFSIKMKMRY